MNNDSSTFVFLKRLGHTNELGVTVCTCRNTKCAVVAVNMGNGFVWNEYWSLGSDAGAART